MFSRKFDTRLGPIDEIRAVGSVASWKHRRGHLSRLKLRPCGLDIRRLTFPCCSLRVRKRIEDETSCFDGLKFIIAKLLVVVLFWHSLVSFSSSFNLQKSFTKPRSIRLNFVHLTFGENVRGAFTCSIKKKCQQKTRTRIVHKVFEISMCNY